MNELGGRGKSQKQVLTEIHGVTVGRTKLLRAQQALCSGPPPPAYHQLLRPVQGRTLKPCWDGLIWAPRRALGMNARVMVTTQDRRGRDLLLVGWCGKSWPTRTSLGGERGAIRAEEVSETRLWQGGLKTLGTNSRLPFHPHLPWERSTKD